MPTTPLFLHLHERAMETILSRHENFPEDPLDWGQPQWEYYNRQLTHERNTFLEDQFTAFREAFEDYYADNHAYPKGLALVKMLKEFYLGISEE